MSHGYVAWLQGDPTAKNAGRLSLNPLRHIDPVGSVILPVLLVLLKSKLLFGWAKPVPFDPAYFKRPRLGIFTVALAGPATNLVLASAFALVFRLAGPADPLAYYWVYGVGVNLLLAMFNLLPLPPLDGSKMLAVLLPPEARRAYLSVGRWGIFLLLLLSYAGVIQVFLMPAFARTLAFFTGLPAAD